MKRTMELSSGNIVTWHTVADLARSLGVNYSTLWSRVARGTLNPPTHRMGRSDYYSADEYERLKAMLAEEIRINECHAYRLTQRWEPGP